MLQYHTKLCIQIQIIYLPFMQYFNVMDFPLITVTITSMIMCYMHINEWCDQQFWMILLRIRWHAWWVALLHNVTFQSWELKEIPTIMGSVNEISFPWMSSAVSEQVCWLAFYMSCEDNPSIKWLNSFASSWL